MGTPGFNAAGEILRERRLLRCADRGATRSG
jgi:hypothetical protein